MRAEALPAALGYSTLALREGPTRADTLGGARFVWREDLAGRSVGGASVRKLEWLLGRARGGGGDVLTVGAADDDALLAAAVCGRENGLRVHVVAWPGPRTAVAEANLRAVHAHAEHVWPAPSRVAAPAVLTRAFATVRVQAGYAPEVWLPGLGGLTDTLAWVEGGVELAEAVAAGALPAPPRVWVRAKSGSTAAGLWLGLALGGLRAELVALDVSGRGGHLLRAHAWRARQALAACGVAVPRLGALRVVAGARAASGAGAPGPDGSTGPAGGAPAAPFPGSAAFADTEGPGCLIATANGRPLEPLLRSALSTLPPRLSRLLEAG